MALTTINSGGVKDDSIVNADIKSDAAIAGSKLAAATTSAAGSMSAADKTKLDGVATSATANPSAPALTGSTNNTVCTVTGANAIQGEANLTFDGTTLTFADTTGDAYIQYGAHSTTANNWTVGAQGDGNFKFFHGTYASGTERLRIDSTGDMHFRNAGTGHQGFKWYKDNNLNLSFTYGDGNANPTLNIYRQDSQSGFPYGNLIINTGSSSNPTQALKLRTDKNIELGGNLIMASGKGIDFSANSNASGKTSELFDDYEEGNFTPTAYMGSTQLSSPAQAVGRYTKVGRVVHINFYIYKAWDGTGVNPGSGSWTVQDMPFTFVGANSSGYNFIPSSYILINNLYSTGVNDRWQVNSTGTSVLSLYSGNSDVAWTSGAIEFAGSGTLYVA